MAEPTRPDDTERDFGLGSRVSQQSRQRFLNRDGSFNVVRRGLSYFQSLSPYHTILTMSWTKFFLLVSAGYFVTNVVFALGYVLCGADALHGLEGYTIQRRFVEEFFFSVQTLATVGYGRLSPNNLAANILVTIEALVGLLGFALATGLLFSRFSRPMAKIIFSENAVVAPYRNMTALMFRIANSQKNQLINVEATISLSRLETVDGKPIRRFYPLKLERQSVVFFPLHWVIVHPIDETSPMFGVNQHAFDASDPEILILLTAVDETFAQTVHARSSYKFHEVVWGAKFTDLFIDSGDGKMAIDLRRIHKIEKMQ